MRLALRELADKALAIVLGLFLLLTLFRGGNTDTAVLFAVAGGLLLLMLAAALAVATRFEAIASAPAALAHIGALLLLLAAGLIGLLSVDLATWLALPGREFYRPLVDALQQPDFALTQLPLSIDAIATRRAILVLLPCIAISISVPMLSRRSLLRVLGAFVILAAGEALLGLFQLGFRGVSLFVIDYAGHSRASGTFVNKNHYATLLAMALPLLIFRATGQFAFFSPRSDASTLATTWWGVVTAFVVAALVASLSRAGLLAGFIVSALAIAACPLKEHFRSRKIAFFAMAIVALAVVLMAMTGLGSMVRSVMQGAMGDGTSSRAVMNSHTWTGMAAFFPVGAGLGSYALAFQRFQTPSLLNFIEYAHNDYLQLVFETGLVGIVILVMLALSVALSGRKLRRANDTPAAACYLGAMAFAIHACFDFPAHIPAIAIIATLLYCASMNAALSETGHRRPIDETLVSRNVARPAAETY